MFSLFGAVFGMSEETIAFMIIFVPFAISMDMILLWECLYVMWLPMWDLQEQSLTLLLWELPKDYPDCLPFRA